MSENGGRIAEQGSWESVHVCTQCSLVVRLSDLDLKAITTGLIECPRCHWTGPIEIEILQVRGTGG
jgi:uncharacterized paraquat-inducible protein A